MIYFQKLTSFNQSYLRFLQMPTADLNALIWNKIMKIIFYNYLLIHIYYGKCYLNTELCNVQDLYSACATSQCHVTYSWNVNNRWDRCLANDRIHTELQHFLHQSYFGMLTQIKMYCTVIIRMCSLSLCAYF